MKMEILIEEWLAKNKLNDMMISSRSLYHDARGLKMPPFPRLRGATPTSREAFTNVEETPRYRVHHPARVLGRNSYPVSDVSETTCQ